MKPIRALKHMVNYIFWYRVLSLMFLFQPVGERVLLPFVLLFSAFLTITNKKETKTKQTKKQTKTFPL